MDAAETEVQRNEFVAAVNALLAHGYNEAGITRWWQRPRTQLGGLSPEAFLGDDFDPTGGAARQVHQLAATLVGPGSVT